MVLGVEGGVATCGRLERALGQAIAPDMVAMARLRSTQTAMLGVSAHLLESGANKQKETQNIDSALHIAGHAIIDEPATVPGYVTSGARRAARPRWTSSWQRGTT